MNIDYILNKIAGGHKGNIIKVNFSIENRDFKALVPDDQYWISIKDILLNREYEYLPEFELKNFEDGTIVDAGAHVGLFSLVASCFAEKVIAIEAHPINYRLFEINITKNQLQNKIIPLNKALVGKKIHKVRIYEGEHSGGSTILGGNKLAYECLPVTLEEIVEAYGKIDLLKIDIEGAEFDVFENSPTSIYKEIGAIFGEIHLNYGDISSIVQILEDAGFDVYLFHPPLVKSNYREVKLHGCYRLKILRKLVYTLASIGKMKVKDLVILFAKK